MRIGIEKIILDEPGVFKTKMSHAAGVDRLTGFFGMDEDSEAGVAFKRPKILAVAHHFGLEAAITNLACVEMRVQRVLSIALSGRRAVLILSDSEARRTVSRRPG